MEKVWEGAGRGRASDLHPVGSRVPHAPHARIWTVTAEQTLPWVTGVWGIRCPEKEVLAGAGRAQDKFGHADLEGLRVLELRS